MGKSFLSKYSEVQCKQQEQRRKWDEEMELIVIDIFLKNFDLKLQKKVNIVDKVGLGLKEGFFFKIMDI